MQQPNILGAVKKASESWQANFNVGDAIGCTNHYEKDAIMRVKPFGTFKGHDQIMAFWQKIIEDGFAEVEYIDPQYEVLDATSVVLNSGWRMNKASGVITKELWVFQTDGTVKLREDDFEITNTMDK